MVVELLCEVIEEDRDGAVRHDDEATADLVSAPVPAINGNGHGAHDEPTAKHDEAGADLPA